MGNNFNSSGIVQPDDIGAGSGLHENQAPLTDNEREAAIELARQQMLKRAAAGDVDSVRITFDRMRDLINGRSPQRVADMEMERGLR